MQFYNIPVRVRSFLFLALVLIGLAGMTMCQCPQSQAELGARPRNFVVREVSFVSTGLSTFAEQNQVTASLVGLCYAETKKNDIEERIRLGFQRFGFFKVRTVALTVEAPDSANPPTVCLIAHVDEGERYRLKAIRFTDNKPLANPTMLRELFLSRTVRSLTGRM